MAARARIGPGRVVWTSHDLKGVRRVSRVDEMLVGGLESVDDGRCCGELSEPYFVTVDVGGVTTACDGDGVKKLVTGKVGAELSSKSDATSRALVVRCGSTGQDLSPFQIGESSGIMADVVFLHGALAAQGCVLPTTAAQREHRRAQALVASVGGLFEDRDLRGLPEGEDRLGGSA